MYEYGGEDFELDFVGEVVIGCWGAPVGVEAGCFGGDAGVLWEGEGRGEKDHVRRRERCGWGEDHG